MNLFSRILLSSASRAAKAAPNGIVMLEFDSTSGSDGNLILTPPSGVARPFGGNARSGTPVHGVKAIYTLTSNGTAPANNATVTIGRRTYTFKTTLGSAANQVLIGASAAAALDNLKSAVNKTSGGGTTYTSATLENAEFVATANTDTTQLFQAKLAGVVGNVSTSDTSVTLSWASTTAGVDCTEAAAGDMLYDDSYHYIAHGNLTTASLSGWFKSSASAL